MSQVSFRVLGEGCENNICNSLANHYKTVISTIHYTESCIILSEHTHMFKTHGKLVRFRYNLLVVQRSVMMNFVNDPFLFLTIKNILINYSIYNLFLSNLLTSNRKRNLR